MDRRLTSALFWNRDRRTTAGRRLTHALDEGAWVSFEDLLDAAQPADVADVATWLAHGVQSGALEEAEPTAENPARRFRMRSKDTSARWHRRAGDALERRR